MPPSLSKTHGTCRSSLSSLLFLPHQHERWLHFPNCLDVFITNCKRFGLPCRSSVFALHFLNTTLKYWLGWQSCRILGQKLYINVEIILKYTVISISIMIFFYNILFPYIFLTRHPSPATPHPLPVTSHAPSAEKSCRLSAVNGVSILCHEEYDVDSLKLNNRQIFCTTSSKMLSALRSPFPEHFSRTN